MQACVGSGAVGLGHTHDLSSHAAYGLFKAFNGYDGHIAVGPEIRDAIHIQVTVGLLVHHVNTCREQMGLKNLFDKGRDMGKGSEGDQDGLHFLRQREEL